jgi:serine phosphatase RsbU (regulator of sigma subunit)
MKRNRQIRLWLTALAAVVMMTLAGCQKTQKVESILTDEETETSQFGGGENLSAIKKNCIKGLAHYQHNEMEPAVNYFSRVIAVKDVPAEDFDSYIQAGVLLMDIYADQYDNEGALRTAMLLIDKLNGAEGERLNELKSIYTTIGRCQLRLNREAEAEESFKKASEYVKRLVGKENASAIDIYNGYVSYSQIVTDYFNANKIVESEPWLDLAELLFGVYKTMPGADPSEIDLLHSDILLNHAMIAVTKGEKEKAARYFDAYKATESSQTVAGRINGSEYLAKAHRYAESADALTCLDELLSNSHMTIDFEVIKTFLLPKLNVNYQAGRKDSALRVAMQVYDVFDSAYTQQKKSEAAKLATIYDTEGKERRIAEQQAEISQQRVIGLVIAIILLTIFFVIYTLLRRRAAKRLAEMKAAQERIESELRIARDIQMSMVPSVFPEREGLDMYASMTPAKEVGGDLYGYLLEGDKLYFALGDVSGKGVPASLFMAQATRLFLTLAKQGMMPAEICSRINDALSGDDNENSMFVTFWLGLVDLTTGHLDFCNAGHNPPIIGDGENGGEFLDMIPNAPIGLLPGLEYEGEEIDSIKGRPLFIYTDGLNEAENPEQEQFGDDHLLDILRSTHFDNTQQVIETLKTEVEKHRNGAEPNDDLTMMCLRVM